MTSWPSISRLRGWFWLILILVAMPAVAGPAPEVAPGEVLLSLGCGSTSGPRVAAALAGLGEVSETSKALGICRVRLRAGVSLSSALARLRASSGVYQAEPNIQYSLETDAPLFTPNDPGFPFQYAPRLIGADRAWDLFEPKGLAILAVIDSGIDSSHPDLADSLLRDASGLFGYNVFARRPGGAEDDFYHGTHVAGIAAARVNNGLGIAGIAGLSRDGVTGVRLMPVKVFDRFGRGSSFSISEGIVWAADHGARVISLSLGSPIYSPALARAVSYAQEKGCLVVAAAGNQGSFIPIYPAALPGVLAVGATDAEDRLTSYSNYGPWVSLAAPGHEILSTTPSGLHGGRIQPYYDMLSGTSMACPHVAAAAAILMAQNPELPAPEVARLLLAHTDPYLSAPDRTLAPGAGRLNVHRALVAAIGPPGPTALARVQLSPSRIEGGQPVTGVVVLRGEPPVEDIRVALLSSAPELVTLPTEVVVPAGASAATFAVETRAVTAHTNLQISASALGTEVSAAMLLEPAAGSVAGIALDPALLIGGGTARATVTLTQPAPVGGARVLLTATPSDRVTLPESVLVPEGATRVTVPLVTRAVGVETAAEITATLGGGAETASLTLLPPAVQAVLLRPNVSRVNRLINVIVILEGPAPAGGVELRVTSDRPELIDMPATISIPEGAREITFRVTAHPATVNTPVQVHVASGGGARAATLTLLPIFAGAGAAAR